MTVIAAVGTALGAHAYDQETITSVFGQHVVGDDASARAVLERLHAHTGVRTRHLALPLEDYPRLDGFTGANDAWLRVGVPLGEDAVRRALALAGLEPSDVDLLMTTTVTGVAAPSLDGRLVQPLGLRPDVKRVPMFGLGCVAGVAGVARVHDYLLGHPDDVAVLLAVELCSLTVQPDDTSVANLVASGLFGDGAAAVVLVGERRAAALGIAGPRVVELALDVLRRHRARHGLGRGVVGVAHRARRIRGRRGARQPRERRQGLPRRARAGRRRHPALGGAPWGSQGRRRRGRDPRAAGRCPRPDPCLAGGRWATSASASVLHVLDATLAAHPVGSDEPVVMLAMGPGFCSELVLLRW